MGHNRNERLEGILVQKDQEIAALETQVRTHIARISILQTRLLSTLDTLDVIQSGQNEELDAMAQTNRRLKDKLQRYSAIVKTAELERDDMRDAVLKLVEKVELSNDYSMWPHSQIHLSSLTGTSSRCRSPVVQAPESDLLIHATTMIEALRRERDFEREAHAQTRDMAQARISSLEAQLSRREAELEFFISGDAHTVSTIPHKHPRDIVQLTDEQLTSEQVISALDDATVARNKRLEIEIRDLYKRLENTRVSASSYQLNSSPPPPPSGPEQRREIQQPLKSVSGIIPQITTLQNNQSTSVHGVLGGPIVYERSRPTCADATLSLPDSLDYQAINDLGHHIKTLDAQIDAFAEARRSITLTLRTDVHKEDRTRVESRKDETHQLRLSERSLRDVLDATRVSARAGENELLNEIQPFQSNPQAVIEDPNDVYSLLESEYGEMSIELATPLLPIRMVFDASSPHPGPPSLYLDPPSIPLPPSPDDHPTSNSPASSQIILSDKNIHHDRSDSLINELENVENALHPP